MINPVNGIGRVYQSPIFSGNKKAVNNSTNVVDVQKEQPIVKVSNSENVTKISFKGQLRNPIEPVIQMKVRGVSHHQKDFGATETTAKDRNVEELANSAWVDGKKLDFEIKQFRNKANQVVKKILLIDPDSGEIGRVPDEIAQYLIKALEKNGDDFSFELASVIAGTTKSTPTIGLRVNLRYTGKDEKVKEKTLRTFDFLLNSEDRRIKDNVLLYQPKATPKQVLTQIFDVESKKNGIAGVRDLQRTIDTIADEINNPKNKNILLLGHCLPDGDTIGCILGMQAAIKSTYPEKRVQCSIDDKLPGLYRDKLPGAETIKRPYNADTIRELEENIEQLKKETQTQLVKEQIEIYEKELAYLRQNEIYFDADIKDGKAPEKYDLVILMDIPTPSRFSTAYKKYIQNAGNVIYIDHHPYHYEEWNSVKQQTGIDFNKIRNQNLALVTPAVPAATQLVTIVADEAGLLDKTMKNIETAKQFVAGIVSGASSDTGWFLRSANYSPEDIQKAVKERPNFLPEGLARWLIDGIEKRIDKKWIREHIVYDISDKASNITSLSPRQKMVQYASDAQEIFEENGFATISISYDEMFDVWQSSRVDDEKVSFIDVQNSFKYSEVMGALRESPDKAARTSDTQVVPYSSPYQDDKISLLLIQDKVKGKLDGNSHVADKNGIRMSFRSQDGTIYAELLASLFNGGGHASAAGARIDIDGVEVDSKIAIKVDGHVEYDPTKIYTALFENHYLKQNNKIPENKKVQYLHKFEPVLDENGQTVPTLLNGIVTEIRRKSFNKK